MWKLITILSHFYYFVTATLFYKNTPTYLCTDPVTLQDYYTNYTKPTVFLYNDWTLTTDNYCSPYHSYYSAVCKTIPYKAVVYPVIYKRRKGKRVLSPHLYNRMLPNQTGQYTSTIYQPWVKYDQLCIAFTPPTIKKRVYNQTYYKRR